jgi:hypothetical protein
MRAIIIAGCLGLALAGCEDASPTAPPKPAATAKASTTPSATATAAVAKADPNAELDNEDIPVPEDFEDEAQKEITKDNLESKLDEIEKELAQDKG